MRDRMIPMFFAPFARLHDRLARALCALLLCSILSHSAAAEAQPTTPHNPPSEAIAGYNRGRALYQAGRYREALVELEGALALDPTSPNLVYNVARVYELLGELDEATAHYERYRSMLPPSEVEERERVASIVLRLQGARSQVRREPAGRPTEALRNPEQTTLPPEPRRGVADPAFWVTAGTGAAALIAGASLGALALSAEKKVDDFVVGTDGSAKEHGDLVDRADRLALSSDVLLMVGTTFAISSVLLYTLREKRSPTAKRRARAELAAGGTPQGFMVTFGGQL